MIIENETCQIMWEKLMAAVTLKP